MKKLSLDIIGEWLNELGTVPVVDKANNTITVLLYADADFKHDVIVCFNLQNEFLEIVGSVTDYKLPTDAVKQMTLDLNTYNITHVTPTGFLQGDLIKFRYSLLISDDLSEIYVKDVGVKRGLFMIKNAFVDFEKQQFQKSPPRGF